MPLTPDEAMNKNRGKENLQFERAVWDLLAEVEKAIENYTGNPVYVALPAYLQYKAQEDDVNRSSLISLKAVDDAMDERFGPAGWNTSIVLNKAQSQYWVKVRDSRGS
jgi:hypothetical protein